MSKNRVYPSSKQRIGAFGKTGLWRFLRPEIKYEKCTKCKLCWLYCPEGAIILTQKGAPKIDYNYCKGCGICAQECPQKCINLKKEEQ